MSHFYWAPLLFLFSPCTASLCSLTNDANYNAKSINNHNHDHNEHTGPQEEDETARVTLTKPVAERWCKTNANPLKDLRYLPRSHIYVNSFFEYGALGADERKRETKREAIKQDACEYPQLLRLWCLNAGTVRVCIVHTDDNLSVDISISVRWSNRHCTIRFKWQFYRVYNIIST